MKKLFLFSVWFIIGAVLLNAAQTAAFGEQRLAWIERALPDGARIYTAPDVSGRARAAIFQTDFEKDGNEEILVVYRERLAKDSREQANLFLAVLSETPEKLTTRKAISLGGSVLFDVEVDGVLSLLTASDVTGDDLPEIFVASGFGSSAGGRLQIFDGAAQSFRRLGEIGGHFFGVQTKTAEPARIQARWKEESTATVCEWDGQTFRPQS